MIDITKTYRTRAGREVTNLRLRPHGATAYPLIAEIGGDDGYTFTDEGGYYTGEEHDNDLIAVESSPAPSLTFDPSKPVQTRDGRKARIACTDRNGTSYPIVALLTDDDGEEYIETYTAEGRACVGVVRGGDLVNVPERHERFFSLGDAYDNANAARDVHCGRWPVLKVVTEGYNGPVISSEIVPA